MKATARRRKMANYLTVLSISQDEHLDQWLHSLLADQTHPSPSDGSPAERKCALCIKFSHFEWASIQRRETERMIDTHAHRKRQTERLRKSVRERQAESGREERGRARERLRQETNGNKQKKKSILTSSPCILANVARSSLIAYTRTWPMWRRPDG